MLPLLGSSDSLEPGGHKCTAVTIEYHTLREGEGEGEVVAVGPPIEWQVVIQPWPWSEGKYEKIHDILFHTRERKYVHG